MAFMVSVLWGLSGGARWVAHQQSRPAQQEGHKEGRSQGQAQQQGKEGEVQEGQGQEGQGQVREQEGQDISEAQDPAEVSVIYVQNLCPGGCG